MGSFVGVWHWTGESWPGFIEYILGFEDGYITVSFDGQVSGTLSSTYLDLMHDAWEHVHDARSLS